MSPELIDHFRNPRNVGELPPPAIRVEVENPVCGDILRLTATVAEGRIAEIRYKVRGCAASIGAGSALTELILAEGAGSIDAHTVERAVGGLSNESKHAAVLCAEAARLLSLHLL
ncbi:MAG: iron-sulfur cluster assembly scaffold protein [Acidobacteriota bacterium]|nr:iron-sulfur cluster assembly scaffold protein [Acidobacteriota bacterium]